ncbi:unnamed protein product [Trichobilharzia regenti]|nr:unnamed protein product [Trichobilharzia regenti]
MIYLFDIVLKKQMHSMVLIFQHLNLLQILNDLSQQNTIVLITKNTHLFISKYTVDNDDLNSTKEDGQRQTVHFSQSCDNDNKNHNDNGTKMFILQ